jgi:predicted O-methyltransferase YrrM
MRFVDVHPLIEGIPHMTTEQARTAYHFLRRTGATRVLELGFAHGVSTCVFAAAMEETGGHVTTIDRVSAERREPNIWELLQRTGLRDRVTVIFEETSYTWALMRFLEQKPMPRFDFIYVDGAHSWDVDGFAFSLVDQLLEPGGWILFDDLNWCLAGSPTMSQLPQVLALPEIQQRTTQVRKVFDLLVKRHPHYGNFRDSDNWGWARKSPTAPLPARVPPSRETGAVPAARATGRAVTPLGATARRALRHLPPPAQTRIRRYRRALLAARTELAKRDP